MKYAQNLKELRKERKMTQKQLANALQISQSILCDYENARSEPTANIIIKIALFFNVSADYLLGLENEDGTKTYNASDNTAQHSAANFK